MTTKMENNLELEIEPPTKRSKMDDEWTSSGISLSPEQSCSNSSAIVKNNEEPPETEDVDEDQNVFELEDSSNSNSDSPEGSNDSEDDDDNEDEAISNGKNSDSLDDAEESSASISTRDDNNSVPSTSKTEEDEQKKSTKPNKTAKKSQNSKSSDIKFHSSKSSSVKNSGKRKAANLRKNIKDILKTEHLGEETLAAQREEAERRHRQNLKLQQQQLKLIQQQQQAQLVKNLNNSSMSGFGGESAYSGLSLDDIVNTISRRKHITVSVDSQDGKFVVNKQPSVQQKDKVNDEIILSSDEEATEETGRFDATSIQNELLKDLMRHRQQNAVAAGHYGEMISSNRREKDQNVISLSSGDEDDDDCNKEVESFQQQQALRTERADLLVKEVPQPVDSDDDCVVISPTPDDDAANEDKNQDEFNIRDEFGRVLVNVGHPDEDPDIFLAPQVARIAKPHQIGGIRFLYDNVVESADRFNTSSGFGCILAHSMGLGKTLQAVSFCDVFLRTAKAKTVLIIVPINTIQNWLNEFNVWLPTQKPTTSSSSQKKKTETKINQNKPSESSSSSGVISETVSLNLSFDSTLNLNLENTSDSPKLDESVEIVEELNPHPGVGEGEVHLRSFSVFVLNETVKTLAAREKIVSDWSARGGVLLIGYEMYRMLALKKLKKTRKPANFFNGDGETDTLNKIHSCIVDPGPDLVICDEGHRIKNSGASISQALKAIRTRRRVVLTGFPIQNNLMEYWCMVDFIRPNYLGSKVEFSNMFERPISNGQCVDSTPEDRRLMRFRSHVLHSLLEGFVQRRSHDVLQCALPEKQEWVFLLKMTPIQYKLYKEFIKYLSENVEGQSAANPIKAFAVCCKIWNHPDALYNVVKKKQSILDDLDLDEVNGTEVNSKGQKSKGQKGSKKEQSAPPQISYFDGSGFNFPRSHYGSYGAGPSKVGSESQALSLDWATPIFQNYKPGVLENGVKFEILFEIIKESIEVKDKLLVFSQTLLSLDLIETFLAQKFNWMKNYQYYRLDGSTTGLEREKLINNFNNKPDIFVFLVSTRAGSLGINLTGANRVVVLDASWNPCHDCQAVCRIYRYGQTKPCRIYRFVSDCTLEKRIYDRQINKRGMSDRVVDEMNPNAQFKSKDVSSFLVLKHDHLDKLPYIKWDYKPEKYSDVSLQNILRRVGDKLTQEPFEHESLLIDQKSQRLSATEKRLAHRNYQNEKRTAELQSSAGYSYNRPSYAAYYPKDNQASSRSAYNSVHSNYRQFSSNTEDKFEQHVPALRAKGICVQSIILKKDSFLADPSGGPDMYLMSGEKVYVLRSEKGTYLRISNGKLIAVRNSASNSRFPGMNVPATQELSKEQLQGLVYSFLKLPGNQSNDSYDYGGTSGLYGDHSSNSYPPTEQPLPPSPSFFSQSKNHLQVTNARNNSGGDVTLWQPLGEDSLTSQLQKPSRHAELPTVNNSSKSLSALLDMNKGPTTFNPNLERLSYLANRFPDFNRKSSSDNRSLPNFPSQSTQLPYFPSQSYPVSSSVTNNNGSLLSSAADRAEVELIPIRKSTPNSSSKSSNRIESPSRSHTTPELDSNLLGNNQPIDFHHHGSSSSPYNNDSFSSRLSNPLFEANPSFYKDFTITVKSPFNNNGNSSGSESSLNNSPKPSRSKTRTVVDSFSGNKSSIMHTSSSPLNQLTTSSPSFNPAGNAFFQKSVIDGTEDPFSQFSQKSNSEADFSAPDFQNMSQYYSNNNVNSVVNNSSNLSFTENSAARNDSVPTFFSNQGL